MVVVKRLDPKYPRLGYEVQKGLMVDMPGGDGKAEITEAEDGSVTLSERDGKYSVSLKNVQLSEFVEHDVRVDLKRGPRANHLTLENVTIDGPTSTIINHEGENVISDTVLSGHNYIETSGQTIKDSFIDDGTLDRAKLINSSVERSCVRVSFVKDSEVVNSDLDGVTVTKDSTIELSDLIKDKVTNATVGGVDYNWLDVSWLGDDRHFKDGYFVGNGKHAGQYNFDNGYVQVADEDVYVDSLANLIVHRDLPYAWDREHYRPSEALTERLEDAWESVPEVYRNETLELTPFLKEVIAPPALTAAEIERSFAEDEAWHEADDFVIDESQFEVDLQQGLQQ